MDVGRDSSRRFGSPFSFSHWPALKKYRQLNGRPLWRAKFLFVYDFDLLIDHFNGKPIDRHMDPVMLFAFNDEGILETSLAQRSSRMRNRSSTSAIASRERPPHLEISRSFEIERIASHKIVPSFLIPPSRFRILTCSGIPRSVEVKGRTTIRSAGPELKKSTERTSTGLRPVCSRPCVGRRSAS